MVYNVIARDSELEMIRLCEAEGSVSMLGHSPEGCSRADTSSMTLANPAAGVKPYPSTLGARYFEAVNRLKEIAGSRSLPQLSLAWMLSRPQVSEIV